MPQDFTGGVKHGFTKEGLARVPLLFPPKLNTLEYRRVEHSGQACGEAGTWTTDISGLGKKLVKLVLLACFAAPSEFGSARVASQAVCYCFFPGNFENGLNISAIALELLQSTLSILLCACLVTKTRPPPGCTSSHE